MPDMRCRLLLLLFAGILPVPAQPATLPAPIQPDPAAFHTTWEGWGTSLCWFAAAFGDRDDLADTLFTNRTTRLGTESLPGLGLNIVRYNAGACADREVDGQRMQVSPNIPAWKQIEGFWLDGKSTDPASASWDWSRDATQRALMLKARDRGANRFELFSNSPMWWMCRNHNPSGADKATDDNLAPEHHQTFAIYLATIAAQAADTWGIRFTTVEPFNEPCSDYWSATGRQEGCHFSVASQASVLRHLRTQLNQRGLQPMRIAASDESKTDWAIDTWRAFDDETRALIDQVNVHGYQGTGGRRDTLRALTRDKPLWNSEYGDEHADGFALAQNIHLDFQYLHPKAWCYWQPLDGGARGGWGLIPANIARKSIRNANPKFFVFAHYTRHIRQGMHILNLPGPNLIAAHEPSTGNLSLVIFNPSADTTRTRLDLSLFHSPFKTAHRWLTEPKGRTRYTPTPPPSLSHPSLQIESPPFSIQSINLQT